MCPGISLGFIENPTLYEIHPMILNLPLFLIRLQYDTTVLNGGKPFHFKRTGRKETMILNNKVCISSGELSNHNNSAQGFNFPLMHCRNQPQGPCTKHLVLENQLVFHNGNNIRGLTRDNRSPRANNDSLRGGVIINPVILNGEPDIYIIRCLILSKYFKTTAVLERPLYYFTLNQEVGSNHVCKFQYRVFDV